MINHRNEVSSDHIVTIEDPIEFLHTNKRSIVNQREVKNLDDGGTLSMVDEEQQGRSF